VLASVLNYCGLKVERSEELGVSMMVLQGLVGAEDAEYLLNSNHTIHPDRSRVSFLSKIPRSKQFLLTLREDLVFGIGQLSFRLVRFSIPSVYNFVRSCIMLKDYFCVVKLKGRSYIYLDSILEFELT
jgi:hypothetical protein